MEKPTILVIGADIGGITAAAYLANNGFKVTVLEKNSTPGGRCSQLSRDGHRFDIGPTLFLIPELVSARLTTERILRDNGIYQSQHSRQFLEKHALTR
jgi:phytoene dehydrogenase-like protein